MSQQLPKIKLLETIVDVSDTQMPAEGDTVTCLPVFLWLLRPRLSHFS